MLIHLGFPKTASTFLQKNVFEDPAGPFLRLDDKHEDLRALRFRPNDNFDPERARRRLDEMRAASLAQGRHPVLSREGFAGRAIDPRPDYIMTMQRLRDAVPDARVMVVIREQVSAQISSYSQYVKGGGPLPLNKFALPQSRRDGVDPRNFFLYDRFVEECFDNFGKDRTLVLPYERLRADPQAFVETILGFYGVQPWRCDWARLPALNTSLKFAGLEGKRLINAFEHRKVDPYDGNERRIWPKSRHMRLVHLIKQLEQVVPQMLEKRMRRNALAQLRAGNGDFFRASNQRCAQMTGMDLGSLGYRV